MSGPGAVVDALVQRSVDGAARVEPITLNGVDPDQVRVRLSAAGVCHSDLSLANGTLRQRFPAVLGHEGAGTVVEVGPEVAGLAVGDRVVLNWAPPCRSCWFCRAGEPYLCVNADAASALPYAITVDDEPVYPGLGTGAFATETVVGAHACIPLPADIPLAEAALLGCAVLTGVGAVLNSARVRAGESVAVIGLGGVGLAALQGARIAGAAEVIAVDPAPAKADLALRLGATHVLRPSSSLSKEVRAVTGGRGADHAIECVGRAETIRAAWSIIRRAGRATIPVHRPARRGVHRRWSNSRQRRREPVGYSTNVNGCKIVINPHTHTHHPRCPHVDLRRLATLGGTNRRGRRTP